MNLVGKNHKQTGLEGNTVHFEIGKQFWVIPELYELALSMTPQILDLFVFKICQVLASIPNYFFNINLCIDILNNDKII